nr:MAG TPA: hypothetical protein [Caudoviricetes sp.]
MLVLSALFHSIDIRERIIRLRRRCPSAEDCDLFSAE